MIYVISVKNLYEKYKDFPTFFRNTIHYSFQQEDYTKQEYYDLYNPYGELVCMDGEEVIMLEHALDSYKFHSVTDTNDNSFFRLSQEEYNLCITRFE